MSYYKSWGKYANSDNTCHLLPYHCLDVGAVAYSLLTPESKRCNYFAERTGLSTMQIRYLVTLLMMFHDLGKFSKSFQSLVPGLYKKQYPDRKLIPYSERHDTLGFLLWRGDKKDDPQSIFNFLESKNEALGQNLDSIIRCGTGHHGIPPKESGSGGNTALYAKTFFDHDDFVVAQEFVGDCLSLINADPEIYFDCMDKKLKNALKEISWQIAGLGILADWIGSNADYFPFYSDPVSLADYWSNKALPQAEKAVQSLGLSCRKARVFQGVGEIFPFIQNPTPLQKLAETIELMPGPQLFIIEDVTGAGKTEAATILASRLMSSGFADGIYIGLPTMATANAMYFRMKSAYRNLYQKTENPSLILSHGSRHLVEGFTETTLLQKQRPGTSFEDDISASAYCNQWYADNRKKALLADVGVGTIDQALIGVLPARHQSLRLLGLQGKILIVDEVHAYDPYMEHLLGVLLEAHARGGGSAILLSATIPKKKRTELINSFQSGSSGKEDSQPQSDENGFPLLTQFGCGGIRAMKVATRVECRRSVAIEFFHSYASILDFVSKRAEEGNCICWIRNTVKDARRAFYDLEQRNEINKSRIDLFHSRYAMIDRARIEEGVIRNFGKTSGFKNRNGRILISTQVVEQSLDLDFDIMISDLAPIDLLIQRAGRLQRHIRDKAGNRKWENGGKDERESPIFFIFAPVFLEEADSKWLSGDFAGTSAVYQNAGVLWRTQRLLEEMKGWKMPEDARNLIEAVYGSGCNFDVPEGLIEKVCVADGIDKSKSSMGYLNALILKKGYCRNAVKADQWDEDDKVPTRLTEENREIALSVYENGSLIPYADAERNAWDWSCFSVSERDWKKTGYRFPEKYKAVCETLKNENPRLKYCEVVIVNGRSNFALTQSDRISECYDQRLGWGGSFSEEP